MRVVTIPAVLGTVLAALFVTTSVPARAQTDEEVACRRAISSNLGKFVAAAVKDIATCHRLRNAGRLPVATNCNDLFMNPRGRSVVAFEKASARMLRSCPDSLTTVLSQFARCPSPHSTLDDDGPTDGIDSFAEATACVLNLGATLANGAAATMLGHPDFVLSRRAASCQAAIGKLLLERIKTIDKVRRSCQFDADRSGQGVQYSCATFDDGSISGNLSHLVSGILRQCDLPHDELVPLHACGQTPEQLARCAGAISTTLGGGLVAAGYELPATCGLGLALMRGRAGFGTDSITSTRFELGSNGVGQGIDLLDDFLIGADLACDDDCVGCSVTLNPLKPSPQSFCRCEADPTVHCDTVDGPDADDCGGGNCRCLFAPPLPFSASGVPVCVLNRFASPLSGEMDGGTGVATTTMHVDALVHAGLSPVRPCPTCEGDLAPNDGRREGTCDGGARSGLACDENANSPDFGPLSYECLPAPESNVSGNGLQLKFDLTSVEAPRLATNLTDGSNEVYCLQCSGDPTVGCSSDAACASRGLGTCSVNTGPPARANACRDGVCTATDPSGEGACLANAPDRYCDGVTRVDGGGLLPCADDADCRRYGAACPGGDCGRCTLLEQRACFPDPLGATGSDALPDAVPAAGVYGSQLVGTLCVPATGNAPIDASVGLPGPARLLIHFDFAARCATDPTRTFELPGGSNCP